MFHHLFNAYKKPGHSKQVYSHILGTKGKNARVLGSNVIQLFSFLCGKQLERKCCNGSQQFRSCGAAHKLPEQQGKEDKKINENKAMCFQDMGVTTSEDH